MKNYLKRFMAWATDLKHNIFERARIRLTLFYVVMMIVIITVFSIALYATIERNIRESLQDDINVIEVREHIYDNTTQNIETLILTIDGFLLIIVAGLGYVLSGRTLRPIKEALEAQKRFSADASHDLRTPLAIITTQTEVALEADHKNINEYKSVLASNLEEIKKMSSLVTDLLSIARTENNGAGTHLIQVLIKSFIEKIVSKISPQAKEKKIKLEVINNIDGSININEHNFERAIQNILQNALRYTNSGGKIIIETKEEQSILIIKISDTGVGIKESDLPFIFDRFYKASHSRNDSSGSGLGLPIAKQIIEAHRGEITLDSKAQVGTTVYISIPKS